MARAQVFFVVALFALVSSAGSLAASNTSIALLPLSGTGLGADELARAERTIRSEVDEHFGKRSVPLALISTRLDDATVDGLRCDRDSVPCIVQLGIVLQADQVLAAHYGAHGTGANTLSV
ncbi:MAG TPA: hypothetical protein VGO62_03125, partial [Myxococcota bacterium]